MRILVCLTTRDNDYQLQQASEAEQVCQSLGVELTLMDAGNDAIDQSQLLLEAIQSKGKRPDAIIFEPVSGTGLPHVARAAVSAGIAWGVLNRQVDYINELRANPSAMVFGIGSNHVEIGRIQAAQVKALVSDGGEVLLIEGPSENAAAKQRTDGFMEKKPHNITIKQLKGKWSEESGKLAVTSWLRLSTSHQTHVRAVVAHNDDMAVGARKAFDALTHGEENEKWRRTPFIGVDGLPNGGQAWIGRGLLKATVIVPPNSGTAIKAVVNALRGGDRPPSYTMTEPISFPELSRIAK